MYRIGLIITWVSTLAFGFSLGVRSEPLKHEVCFRGTALRVGSVSGNYLDIQNPSTREFYRIESFGPIPTIDSGTYYTFYLVGKMLVGVKVGCN